MRDDRRPFTVLYRHFLGAFLDNDLIAPASDLHGPLSKAAAALAVLGLLYPFKLLGTYGRPFQDYAVLDGSTSVNVFNDTITFGSAHHFQDGDILAYSSDLISDTSGLVDGGRYRVTVIDADTIQLSDSRIIESLAVSAAVSVAVSSSVAVGVSAAGAVAHNTIGGGYEASAVRSDVVTDGDVDVIAEDSSAILARGGSTITRAI